MSLMNKWVIRALEPGDSPLHLLLRHRLAGIQPPGSGRWPRSLQWSLLARFHAPRGSPLWNRLTQGWRRISPYVDASPPSTFDEVLNTSLWWTTVFVGIGFGFSKQRGRQLAHRGLLCLRDLWLAGSMTLRPWPELQQAYGLTDAERQYVDRYQLNIPPEWVNLFHDSRLQAVAGDWLGVFPASLEDDPSVLFQASPEFKPMLPEVPTTLALPATCPRFIVGSQSRGLLQVLEHPATIRSTRAALLGFESSRFHRHPSPELFAARSTWRLYPDSPLTQDVGVGVMEAGCMPTLPRKVEPCVDPGQGSVCRLVTNGSDSFRPISLPIGKTSGSRIGPRRKQPFYGAFTTVPLRSTSGATSPSRQPRPTALAVQPECLSLWFTVSMTVDRPLMPGTWPSLPFIELLEHRTLPCPGNVPPGNSVFSDPSSLPSSGI